MIATLFTILVAAIAASIAYCALLWRHAHCRSCGAPLPPSYRWRECLFCRMPNDARPADLAVEVAAVVMGAPESTTPDADRLLRTFDDDEGATQ